MWSSRSWCRSFKADRSLTCIMCMINCRPCCRLGAERVVWPTWSGTMSFPGWICTMQIFHVWRIAADAGAGWSRSWSVPCCANLTDSIGLVLQVRHFALHTLEHMLKVRWLPLKDVEPQKGEPATTPPVSQPGQVRNGRISHCPCRWLIYAHISDDRESTTVRSANQSVPVYTRYLWERKCRDRCVLMLIRIRSLHFRPWYTILIDEEVPGIQQAGSSKTPQIVSATNAAWSSYSNLTYLVYYWPPWRLQEGDVAKKKWLRFRPMALPPKNASRPTTGL